jgi:hypothetical protein
MEDRIREALDRLVDHAIACAHRHLPLADRVAVVLCRGGFRAAGGDPLGCPVGAYLTAVVGTAVAVTGETVGQFRNTAQPPRAVVVARRRCVAAVPLPDAVAAFVKKFDAHAYPELRAA